MKTRKIEVARGIYDGWVSGNVGSALESLDPSLAALCLKALAKAPAERYASMSDFAAALDGYLAATSGTVAKSRTPRTAPPPNDPTSVMVRQAMIDTGTFGPTLA